MPGKRRRECTDAAALWKMHPTRCCTPARPPCDLAGEAAYSDPFPAQLRGFDSFPPPHPPLQAPQPLPRPLDFLDDPSFFTSLRPACLCALRHVTARGLPRSAGLSLHSSQSPRHPHVAVSHLVWPSPSRFGPCLTSHSIPCSHLRGSQFRALPLSPV